MNGFNEPPKGQKTPRRYAFACSNCRKKKIRCCGTQPNCRACVKSEEVCQYPKKRMEVQLLQAQQRIKDLESELRQTRNSGSLGCPSNASESPGRHAGTGDSCSESDQEVFLYSQIGLDEGGSLTYHGPTSRFHVGPVQDAEENRSESGDRLRERLREIAQPDFRTNHELLHSVWEPLLLTKTESDFGIAPDLANHLLTVFWHWQHPLHNCVYKPCFIMDLALGGPYCSRFLLMSIFALAARHCTHESILYKDKGENFLTKAKELLIEELGDVKPKIPTIQGLLVLGGRQCAVGKTSEGWLFSGMAFRMMTDIGLHLDMQVLSKHERLTPTDIEARKRLAFSAFIWDKTLSLSLGRPPSLTRLSLSIDDIFDEMDDAEPWKPMGCEDVDKYPATMFLNTTTFKNFCGLGEIITTILATVYNRERSRVSGAEIVAIQQRLERWYEQLPPALKIDDAKNLEFCPPPHILSLNLLYHTLLVILYRPYLHIYLDCPLRPHALQICSQQASIVHSIFVLYGRTFRYKAMTYLISYCVYTAATVDVYFMKAPDADVRHDAALRLSTSLRILETEARQTPGIRRSIDIIKRQMSSSTEGVGQAGSNGQDARARDRRTEAEISQEYERQRLENGPIATTKRNGTSIASTSTSTVANGLSTPTLSNGFHNTSNPAMSHPTRATSVVSLPHSASMIGLEPFSSFDTAMPSVTPAGEFNWNANDINLLDSGAGFNPDAFAWSFNEALTGATPPVDEFVFNWPPPSTGGRGPG